MDSLELICVTCPQGCTLAVEKDGDTVVKVTNGCKRGHAYARQELTDPKRMVASSVQVEGALHPLLPVYTSAPIPKGKIQDLMELLRAQRVSAPVRMGQVLLANVLDTGVDIIASRDM